MKNRNQALESIRIQIEVKTEKASVFESFQSITLRPILKFQNELLLSIFANYIADNKVNFLELKDEKKEELIHLTLKKSLALKSLLLGCIIGYFTSDEYLFYVHHKNEINKRMVELLIKRISDQKENLF